MLDALIYMASGKPPYRNTVALIHGQRNTAIQKRCTASGKPLYRNTDALIFAAGGKPQYRNDARPAGNRYTETLMH